MEGTIGLAIKKIKELREAKAQTEERETRLLNQSDLVRRELGTALATLNQTSSQPSVRG